MKTSTNLEKAIYNYALKGRIEENSKKMGKSFIFTIVYGSFILIYMNMKNEKYCNH